MVQQLLGAKETFSIRGHQETHDQEQFDSSHDANSCFLVPITRPNCTAYTPSTRHLFPCPSQAWPDPIKRSHRRFVGVLWEMGFSVCWVGDLGLFSRDERWMDRAAMLYVDVLYIYIYIYCIHIIHTTLASAASLEPTKAKAWNTWQSLESTPHRRKDYICPCGLFRRA